MNRLVFLENTGTSGVISSYRYTLDPVGNRKVVEEHDGRKVEYNYDDLYRLTQEKITDPAFSNRTINYTYDAVGNRKSINDSVDGLTNYIYDNNDRLLSDGSSSYTYDNNGNTLSRIKDATERVVYSWDYENRLVGADITKPSGTVQTQYKYNPDSIRVATIVNGQETRYLIDANQAYAQVLEEYAPSGAVQASYVYGKDLISQNRGGVRSFYHVDGLGSTRTLTNTSGNVTDTYDYEAYGNLLGTTGSTVNNYRFTGEQFDPYLGQYYLRRRYYDPSSGRFGTTDPFEGVMTEPLSLAKYPYVHGNPVNATDPSGLFADYRVGSVIALHLAAINSPSLRSPVGTIRRLDTDDVVVPGYLKNINHRGVNNFINAPITGDDYQVVRRKVEECNSGQGAGNCDLSGFPIIVWGNDLPEITRHTSDAIVRTGQSFLARIQPGWSQWAGLASPPGSGGPISWYNAVPGDCQWIQGVYQPQFEGRDCDEYPYNSTLQGGPLNFAAGRVDLRLVDRQQNRLAGRYLGGQPNPDGRSPYMEGFYQFAPVHPNHPRESWFGVQVTNTENTYWKDRIGFSHDLVDGSIDF